MSNNDIIDGTSGDDTLDGANGSDIIDGGAGDDTISGGNGADELTGGSGDDILDGGNGKDILYYIANINAGDSDYYDGNNGKDTLDITISETTLAAWGITVQDIIDYFDAYKNDLAGVDFNNLTVDNGFDLIAVNMEDINVNVVANSAPSDIDVDNLSVDENNLGAVIGNVSAVDADLGETITYSVDDARFEVDNGVLKLKAGESLDFESESSVTVNITATDSLGAMYTESFIIAVNDVNEAPTDIALSNNTVDENDAGAIIGALTVTDPDVGDSHSFTLSDNRFEVVGGNLKLKDGVSLDYDSETSVLVNVKATDSGGLMYDEDFEITVVNDPGDDGPVLIDPLGTNINGQLWLDNPSSGFIGQLDTGDYLLLSGLTNPADLSSLVLEAGFGDAINIIFNTELPGTVPSAGPLDTALVSVFNSDSSSLVYATLYDNDTTEEFHLDYNATLGTTALSLNESQFPGGTDTASSSDLSAAISDTDFTNVNLAGLDFFL